MEYLGSAVIVFAILVGVAVAAVVFEPANPLEKWLKLVEAYGSERRPAESQFTGQQVLFGAQRGGLKPLGPSVTFDATIDDVGLWLVLNTTERSDIKPVVQVPGSHIRPAGRRRGQYSFDLYAEPPVRIAISGELGAALHEKASPVMEGYN